MFCNSNPISSNTGDTSHSKVKQELWTDTDGAIDYTVQYKYDSKNRISRTDEFDDAGLLMYYSIFEYTTFDSIRKIVYYDKDGSFEDSTTYDYDQNMKKIRENVYFDSDGDGQCDFVIYAIYEYNYMGKIAKETWLYPPDDTLEWYMVYRYNSNDQLLKTEQYFEYETSNPDEYSTYTFNNNGRLVRKDNFFVSYNGNTETSGYESYQYDASGRKSKVIYYDAIESEYSYLEYMYF
ncbi:MAG: hypothetical protein GX660_05465 [Clostridiaceae bacterium]|nr:hypothetical protein [Clostridiaceae bacterium]